MNSTVGTGPYMIDRYTANSEVVLKRILAAYWIYQERLDQETPTLKALATGGWAQYIGQDGTATASN